MWVPRFVCPECRTDLVETGLERVACGCCGRVFDRRGGGWRFLTDARGARLEPLIRHARQADFDALPFGPSQFDLVVFNGSLHYAADAGATLEGAHRTLTAGGALVVMDSPMFLAEAAPTRVEDVYDGAGFLTFGHLAGVAEKLALRPQFVPSRGPLTWRLRRGVARLRSRRAPASFGLWVAR